MLSYSLASYSRVELNHAWALISPSSSFSIRWSATSACSKAAQEHTARRETCGHTRRHTGASTHLCAINRAVERPFSPLTASRSMSVFTPRRSLLSVMFKAVRRPLTRYTGRPSHSFVVLCFTSPHGAVQIIITTVGSVSSVYLNLKDGHRPKKVGKLV